jgi:hypothetical protein
MSLILIKLISLLRLVLFLVLITGFGILGPLPLLTSLLLLLLGDIILLLIIAY